MEDIVSIEYDLQRARNRNLRRSVFMLTSASEGTLNGFREKHIVGIESSF